MPYSPYRNEAHEHQFKRFMAKGLLSGLKTRTKDFIKDKDNFTKEEREEFGRILSAAHNALLKWKNTLLKKEKKCQEKKLKSA